MNDFAKEELLEIYGLLEHHYCDPELCLNPNPKLLIKIHSLIDNYCEHKDAHIYEKIKLCLNCERSIDDNQ